MNKTNVMELEHTIDFLSKKIKLAKCQLETMKDDEMFGDNDLWLLASSLLSTLNVEEKNIREKFDIQ